MKIAGQNFTFIDTFKNSIAIADSWVANPNKTGSGNGEAKLYISNKDTMREFYGHEGFTAQCFITKADMLTYMNALQSEYLTPSQDYRQKDQMQELWKRRIFKINGLPDIITFTIQDQRQIAGSRGYVNSEDEAYNLIREIALPYVSYIAVMKLQDGKGDIYYWKLFADFAELDRRRDYVQKYGTKTGQQAEQIPIEKEEKHTKEYRQARDGQGEYRRLLLQECPMCPITGITEEALLIASHIKPWSVCEDNEKIDPKNGFILSPLYDKLFDRGFITFTPDRRVKITNWLSVHDKKRIGIADNQQIPILPLDNERVKYLDYHQNIVFRG